MEEEIKGEERSADEAGKHGNDVVVDGDDDPWVTQMEGKLAFKSEHCKPSHPFTICRVPRDIRSVDNVAHDPLIVSIGPYHRGNPNLHEMEEVKWRNLNETRRRAGNNFKKYLKAMMEMEPRARDCYSGNINMEADEFREMMLLDGLFIIEVLLNRGRICTVEPIFTIRGMLGRVGRDMLLLENQLPFFVLKRLWDLTGQRKRNPLWKSACGFIRAYAAVQFEHEWDSKRLGELFAEENITKQKKNREIINADCVHHLLHLEYLLLKPTSLTSEKSTPTTGSSSEYMEPIAKLPAFIKKMKTLSFLPPRCRDCFPSLSSQESQSMECTAKLTALVKKMKSLSLLHPRCHSSPSPSGQESQSTECTAKLTAVVKKILPFLSPSKSEDEQPPPLKAIPSAVELHEAGVVFKCVKAKSFLDVKFEQGTMKMSRLSVVDSTKPLLRNFIAYEQCFPDQGDHITSYCCFMDDLVNTPTDVEILKRSSVIENRVGSDEEVAILFNDLCKGTFVSNLGESYLGESFKDVIEHTQKTWPKWRARLTHDYFSNPWAIISVLAATFAIILTAVQTYYAVVA